MTRDHLRIRCSIIVLLLLLLVPSSAYAVPISLQLTVDELTQGLAVLSGDIDDTFSEPTLLSVGLLTAGTNWEVRANISRNILLEYDIQIQARHTSNPAPHPGEATPGLLLGGGGEVKHFNIVGNNPLVAPPGPQDASHQLIHPGSVDHYDVLKSHIDDLNGVAPGFLTADNQLSVRITLAHTPEPATLALFGAGLMGLGGFRKKKK